MNAAMPSLPARIVKRAEVDAGLARQSVKDGAVPRPAPALPAAPPVRSLAKEARLLPLAAGGSVLEVRCSCGEWTHLELNTSERGLAEGNR